MMIPEKINGIDIKNALAICGEVMQTYLEWCENNNRRHYAFIVQEAMLVMPFTLEDWQEQE